MLHAEVGRYSGEGALDMCRHKCEAGVHWTRTCADDWRMLDAEANTL